MKWLTLTTLILLASTAWATAEPVTAPGDKCRLAFTTGSVNSALRYCAAAAGDDNASPEDLFRYGKILLSSSGRNPPRPEEAFTIFMKSASRGDPAAFYNLGNIAYRKHDYTSALHFYTQSAQKNHPGGTFQLANLYREGKGTDTDLNQAYELYQKAAALGDPRAMTSLRDMYSLGNPVFSVTQSYFWALAATENGDYNARANLGTFAKRLSAAEQQEQKKKLKIWEEELGDPEEQCLKLKNMDSPDAAFGFCQRSAFYSSRPQVYENLGLLLQSDILNRLSDQQEAFHWLLKAAVSGSTAAEYKVGLYYSGKIHSNLIRPNYPQAIAYLQKAADRGHQNACLELGMIYEEKLAGSPERKEAERWYEKAARLGSEEGAYYLGRSLLYSKNYSQAAFWLKIAQSWGYRTAAQELNRAESRLSAAERLRISREAETFLKEDLSAANPEPLPNL